MTSSPLSDRLIKAKFFAASRHRLLLSLGLLENWVRKFVDGKINERKIVGILPDVEMLRKEQTKHKSSSEKSEESSEALSVHIVEEVNVAQQASDAEFQVQNPITVGAASECSSDDDDEESLQSEMFKLCGEIENANGTKLTSVESSVDLTYQEDKVLQNMIDKVKSMHI